MRKAIPLLVALILTGCATSPTTNWIKALAVACDSYATSVVFLTLKRAERKLSPPQVRTINDVMKVVGPVCRPATPVPSPRDAFLSITDEIQKLVAMKGEV